MSALDSDGNPWPDPGEGFGFRIIPENGKYSVNLPHQCGAWGITGRWDHTQDFDTTVELLNQFIQEAKDIRDELIRARTKNVGGY